MADIFPVILSGGSGTRLWPLSRTLYPKQYINLDGDTLFGETLDRVMSLDKVSSPIVICNEEHRFLAAAIMQGKGFVPSANEQTPSGGLPRLLLEPMGRNTAPAIALSAFCALEMADDPVLLVLPSDHKVAPHEAFALGVTQAVDAAMQGNLVTFGVVPAYPATGYGYIIKGERLSNAFKVERFVEKPDAASAEKMIEQGNCLWNSGMFVFKAQAYLDELKFFAPDIYESAVHAWKKRRPDLDFVRIDAESFALSPDMSVDYAVMEHTQKACVVPFDAQWHDMGAWESFHAVADRDDNKNSTVGDVQLIDAKNSYVYASSRLVAGIGIKDVVVVESPDAVLVMQKGHGQDVKKITDWLKQQRRSEADAHLKVYRPWGTYETLALSERFQVKRIIVKPGGTLSMQLHHHRAEHWVVVRGTAKITRAADELLLGEDQSAYIPLGVKHRLENPGHIDLELIEVQSGSYLGEDDIVRFDDKYGR